MKNFFLGAVAPTLLLGTGCITRAVVSEVRQCSTVFLRRQGQALRGRRGDRSGAAGLPTILCMAFVYLVRHGQASFLANDYDQLSARGRAQAGLLGALWREQGPPFDAVWTGTLRRHEQTLAALSEELPGLPPPQATPALNEYDAEALLRALQPAPVRPPKDTAEGYRAYFVHLRQALGQWMDGALAPPELGTFVAFRQALVHWLQQQQDGTERRVLVVSSGGPISTLVGHVLGVTPATMVDLNFQMRNTAVSTLLASRSRCQLLSFNELPHLQQRTHRTLLTSA